MNPKRDEIMEKYKELYCRKFDEVKPGKSLMPIHWGFEHGDGWLPLIEDLSGAIQYHVDNKRQKTPDFKVEIHQCKEKFGTLRFYVSGADDFIHGLITMAEYVSARTCEHCGSPGKLHTGGWHIVLCDACKVVRDEKRKLADKPVDE